MDLGLLLIIIGLIVALLVSWTLGAVLILVGLILLLWPVATRR